MKEIFSAQHPLIKYWTNLRSDAHFRKTEGTVLLEGKNCIQDICKSTRAKCLIVTDPTIIPKGILADDIYIVTDALMNKISGVKSPEGIIAELYMPKNAPFSNVKKILVADRIQDPGNLGTLIRSSLAFGWDGIFILPGTSDPFNDKALRAAKGATFLLPIYSGGWKELQDMLKTNNLKLVVADTTGKAPSSFLHTAMALVLGNEAQGAQIPSELPYEQVTLNMQGAMESLNVAVAGSILLYLYQEGT